jgi:hypothetical protein
MASKKKDDPTVTSEVTGPRVPGGHAPRAPGVGGHHSADKREYKDNPDKPDPSSIAQVEVLPEESA